MTTVVPHSLTPAETGLDKACTACGRRLPLHAFYIRVKDKLTQDGRRYRMSRCAGCFNRSLPPDRAAKRVNEKARGRAQRRLTKMVPELYEQVLAEELAKEGVA